MKNKKTQNINSNNRYYSCLHFSDFINVAKNNIHRLVANHNKDYPNVYKNGERIVLINYENFDKAVFAPNAFLVEVIQTGIQVANQPIFYSLPKDSESKLGTDLLVRGLSEVTYKFHPNDLYKCIIKKRILKSNFQDNKGKVEEYKEEILKRFNHILSFVETNDFWGIESFKEIQSISDLLDTIIEFLSENSLINNLECVLYFDNDNYNDRYQFLLEKLEKVADRAREVYENKNTSQMQNQALIQKQDSRNQGGFDTEEKKAFYEKIKNIKKLSKEYKKELYAIVKRLPRDDSTTKSSALEYLDTVLSIPFDKVDLTDTPIKAVQDKLSSLQYGIDKAKERILEYIAVQNRQKDNSESNILCLVGPPGVGKTFFAKNVAKSMGKKYTAIALGGMTEVVLLRGEQRGWVGSGPGLLVKALIRTKSMNPVIVLDEIDKIGDSARASEVQAALLEILDPQQNYEFRDHFINIPIDISKVLFITTANYISDIPLALKDRLEIIEIDGYTEKEKCIIAKDYTYPSLFERYNVEKEHLKIDDKAWEKIINSFSYEPGMRGITRTLNQIFRKAVLELSMNNDKKISITKININKYCDLDEYAAPKIETKSKKVGIGIGMVARTYRGLLLGGGPLLIEMKTFKGEGKLQATGLVEKVLKESILIAKTYLRANSKKFNIDEDHIQNKDLNIHMPEGAIPKDGPSAGVILALTMLSAYTNTPIRQDIAVTGELNLQGHVLPVGGIRQKVSGTYRSNIRKFILPRQNKHNWKHIPEEIRKEVKVAFVDSFDEVAEFYFSKNAKF